MRPHSGKLIREETEMHYVFCLMCALFVILLAGRAWAGSMTYVPGRANMSPPMNVAFSTNRGSSWQQKTLKPGTTVSWPATATNLNVNGMPLDPKKNYRVKEGNIAER